MRTKNIKTLHELWHFIIVDAPPLDFFLLLMFWPYLLLWAWLSLKYYVVEGWYNDHLVAVMVYKKPKLYYLGIAKRHRGKGLARKMIASSGCSEFVIMAKRDKAKAKALGFKVRGFKRFSK